MENMMSLKPEFLTSTAVATMLELLLNKLLFRDQSMKAIRASLANKVLRIEIKELPPPLLLLFSPYHVDVLTHWEDTIDCTIKTGLSALAKLGDPQQLSSLIHDGQLIVEGNIQIAQQLVTLLDFAQWDPTEYLVPYIGDIAAETVAQMLGKSHRFLTTQWKQQQRYWAEAITEEWKIAPPPLEVAWFSKEVDAVLQKIDRLSARLDLFPKQLEDR
ncbi:ubiquinone biosynthesis protein UbiJ [Candidatus Regiella insecticola]|uniref:Ubiquinone biosynthesis accessory factor UbiJ n=2 Tax=Candidatus Regiella insecticola TaxID=138073 RepID=A0A6L2ZLM8_9ENTR|nr:ubiquinone biosynthesis protein UbiJ [Candidatus Regiella insecticola]